MEDPGLKLKVSMEKVVDEAGKSEEDDDVRLVIQELHYAEISCRSIQQAEKQTQVVFSKLRGSEFSVTPLDKLIQDLTKTYALIRREILTNHPEDARHYFQNSTRIAGESDTCPPLQNYSCLCPLTLFLQFVASSLTRVRVNIAIDTTKLGPDFPSRNRPTVNHKEDWGVVKPLRDILIRLSKGLGTAIVKRADRPDYQFVPAVAQCLMFHKENSAYIITSSAVRYKRLPGLQDIGRRVRRNYMKSMKDKFSPEIKRRTQAVEDGSTSLFDQYNMQLKMKKNKERIPPWNNPFDSTDAGVTPVQISGQNATFDPKGKYKLGCLIDFCCFVMERPLGADFWEKRQIQKDGKAPKGVPPKRPGHPADSCAEWEM
ncbi:hypothetical protein QBC43DRAFT_291980 [Cladorrhinum sp. PSN259]|nr:hypothetical protein QBC43DRAFT_291980 [Cladorrhinum sp. PSN259]